MKASLRKAASALRHSRAGNLAFAGRNLVALWRTRRGETVGIDVAGAMGMGAMLTHLTMALAVCERRGLRPAIRFTNPLYGRGGDWFGECFEQVAPPGPARRAMRLQKDIDHRLLGSPRRLSLADGKALFEQHVRVRAFLHDEAAALLAPFAAPLGVHYRGTDKHSEAPTVARAAAIAAVRGALPGHDAVFLATDEPDFAADLRAALTDMPVVMYEGAGVTAQPGRPLHFAPGDGHAKGVDALVNILALARCDTVVRTASFLSGWAAVLNPEQRVIQLNRAFSDTRFPENVIVFD